MTSRVRNDVTIVGASLAGIRAAEILRRDGFDGRITLIGDEARVPYDRPPLSKQVLAGTMAPEKTQLLADDALAALDLDLHLGRRATSLDVATRTITLDGEEQRAFDGLLIATGEIGRAHV